MNEYQYSPEEARDNELQDLVSTLNNINFQLAELKRIKEALEPRVAELLNHTDDGSKSYTVGKWKITAKTGYIYSLNKEEYQISAGRLPQCFNFVKQRISFDIDKATLRDAEKYASAEELELIATMVSKKPSKLNVLITSAN
jgi:hypothetical protein